MCDENVNGLRPKPVASGVKDSRGQVLKRFLDGFHLNPGTLESSNPDNNRTGVFDSWQEFF